LTRKNFWKFPIKDIKAATNTRKLALRQFSFRWWAPIPTAP